MSNDEPEIIKQAEESPLSTVWKLAWPAVALNALQTINSLLDSYFVSHLEGDALTAIGAATTTLFLLISLSMAVGVASTAMVARAYGEGDPTKYREANRKCLGFAILSALILTIVAVPFAPTAAAFLIPGDAPHAARLMAQYLGIVTLVLIPSFIIQTLAGSLRGIGDTKSPMVISGLQIGLHIVLNYLLIFSTTRYHFHLPKSVLGNITFPEISFFFTTPGAGMGLNGAALALVLSAWISALIYLISTTRTPLGEVWRIKFPGMDWVKRIFNLAAPAGLMSVVRVTSLMAFTSILTQVPNGKFAIGAIRPGFSIEALAFMPSFGLAIAASALVGQSLGAKDPARAKKLGWIAAHQAGIVSTVAAIFIFIFADPITRNVLQGQPEYAAQAASYLRHVCTTETLFGYAMVLLSAMQGAGDTKRPFWLTLIGMWIIRVPLAMFMSLEVIKLGVVSIPGLGMGADGAWTTLAITQAVQGLACIVLWQQGKWAFAKV